MMARKTRRIEIKKIANEQSKYVTFSKRRTGLFKKAQEACARFNMEIGIVIISPANIVYECDENTRNLVDRFLSSYNHPCDSLSEAEIDDQLGDLEAIEAQLKNMMRDDDDKGDDDLDLDLNLNSNSGADSGSEAGITEEEVNSILDEYLRH